MEPHPAAPLPPPAASPSPASVMAAEARRNPWWWVAALGIAVVLLGRAILFLDSVGDGRDSAGAAFLLLLGGIAVVAGLTLAALLQPVMGWGSRTALLLGAAIIALGGVEPL
jgi:uncharacterized membrane protein HdeD (DUF308 family)